MGLTRLRAEQISDIDYKQAVRVITVTNITLSGGAPNQVDGVNLVIGDRILVNGQNTGSQNGIYEVQTVGTGSNGTWIRSTDTNATGELQAGTIVMVTEGTVYKDTQWKLTTNNPIVIGTTALTFEQNSAFAFGNVYANGTAVLANTVGDVLTLTAGNNIQITGNNTAKSVTIAVTGISLNSISNGTSNVNVVSSGGNVTVGVGGTANVAEFSTGGLKVTGFASATGNVTGGNILTAGLISATSTITSAANVTGGNILTGGLISATGNVTGGNLSIVADALISGNLSVAGNATLSGNILGDRIINGNTSIEIQTASGNANVSVGGTSNVAVFTTAGLNISGVISASGNIRGSNLLTAGLISATSTITSAANITGGNMLTGGLISATSTITSAANVIGGNITTGGLITATGNITGGNMLTSGIVSAGGAIISNGGYIRANGQMIVDSYSGSPEGGQISLAWTGVSGLTGQGNGTWNLDVDNSNTFRTFYQNAAGTTNVMFTLNSTNQTANFSGNIGASYYYGNGAFLTGLSAGSSNGISNGATSISIPVASGNITMSVAGQANTVVINLGSLTMYGTFAGPKTLNANVEVANAVNAVIFGPVIVNDGYNITVPDASTLYTYSGT
jgi:hypothetical protein